MTHLQQPKTDSKLLSSKKTSLFESLIQEDILNPGSSLKFIGQKTNQPITFYYNKADTYSLCNRDLVLRNYSNSHCISFKVESNNPTHYKVHPSAAEIFPKKTMEILIEINDIDEEEIAEIGPSFFAKFATDKFRIRWFTYRQGDQNYGRNSRTYRQHTMTTFSPYNNEKVYPVHIEIVQTEQNEEEIRKRPADLGEKMEETMQIHKKQLFRLEELIAVKEMQKMKKGYLSCWTVAMLSMMAMAVGLLLPL